MQAPVIGLKADSKEWSGHKLLGRYLDRSLIKSSHGDTDDSLQWFIMERNIHTWSPTDGERQVYSWIVSGKVADNVHVLDLHFAHFVGLW